MPVVYLDVIWLVNLVLDGFILLVTAFLARRKMRTWRMIGASVIGASYALFLFFPMMSAFLTFFCKFLFSILMVWVAFAPKGLLDFLKMTGLFYLASFVTGGTAFAANGFFQNSTVQNGLVLIQGGAVWQQQTTLVLVLVAIPLVWWLGKSAWNRLSRSKHREQNMWSVTVKFGGQEALCTGLLDTGNALTDPLSRTPVMVMDWELFEHSLPPELTDALRSGSDISMRLGEIEMDEEWQSRFRLVPYRGVGGTMGMLLAFRPDEVTLTAQDPGAQQETYSTKRVLVGLNPRPLAADGSYRAILHPAMVQEGQASESSPVAS